jgi:WD40 repeat protein
VSAVAWSPDGRYIASGSHDAKVKIWDAGNGRELRTISGHRDVIKTIAFSPDSLNIVSGSSVDATLRIWDLKNGRELKTIGTSGIETVSYSPDGRFLASGAFDNTIRIWDAGTGRELRTLTGRASWARTLAYSPDGR